MNENKLIIDASGMYAELIAIKAIVWAFAVHQIPEGPEWDRFVSLYDKHLSSFAKAFDEAEKNRK